MVKVLIPLDGSARSHDALAQGLRLLSGVELEVTLLAVLQAGFEGAGEDRVQEFDEDEDDEIFPTQASADRMLETAKQTCAELGMEAKTVVRSGRVVKEILAAAEGQDLLLMHALDRTGLLEKVRMSATEKLARRAPCSVLLVAD